MTVPESVPPESVLPEEPPPPESGQELGRIARPAAAQYRGRRRLLLTPLLYAPPLPDSPEDELAAAGQSILQRYWEQVGTQVDALAAGLGGLRRIYHESLTEGGAAGLAYLQLANPPSHALAQALDPAGAALEATETWELLSETLDLQRCLLTPFTNESVFSRIREWFDAANRRRYEHIARRIDETLEPDTTGLLLINERHQVQFPADIEVFYIAPPALDEYRRWLQNWAARLEMGAAEMAAAAPGEDGGGSDDGVGSDADGNGAEAAGIE